MKQTLDITNPDLVKEWHPTKNGDLKPSGFTKGSGKKAWWLCKKTCSEGCPHEWETIIKNRATRGDKCPFCGDNTGNYKKRNCIHDSISRTHPEIAKEWHPTKNGELKPSDFTKGSTQNINWICPNKCPYGCLHEWETSINTRTSGHGCPYCIKLNTCEHDSIFKTNPELEEEWDYELNKDYDHKKILRTSHEIVNWKCKKDSSHSWQTKIRNRCFDKTGCVWCVNKTESKLNDYLINQYPSLVRQFKLDSCKSKRHLPFDFCIPELKTIIELDGRQHFKEIKMFKNNVEESIKRDVFKMQNAIKEGYKIIRIFQEDVYNNDNNFLEEHLYPHIISKSRDPVYITSVNSMYDIHIELLKKQEEIILELSD